MIKNYTNAIETLDKLAESFKDNKNLFAHFRSLQKQVAIVMQEYISYASNPDAMLTPEEVEKLREGEAERDKHNNYNPNKIVVIKMVRERRAAHGIPYDLCTVKNLVEDEMLKLFGKK
jgi:hypothetical protein